MSDPLFEHGCFGKLHIDMYRIEITGNTGKRIDIELSHRFRHAGGIAHFDIDKCYISDHCDSSIHHFL